jgi:Gram-negative bacterial TonB protein C-terminal
MRNLFLPLLLLFFTQISWAQTSTDSDTTVYEIVEEGAEPIGGYEALFKIIDKNLKIPPKYKKMGVEFPKLYLHFIIEKNGEVSHLEVKNKGEEILDAINIETLEALQKQLWKPAQQRGKKVRQKIIVTINICLK